MPRLCGEPVAGWASSFASVGSAAGRPKAASLSDSGDPAAGCGAGCVVVGIGCDE